MSYEAESDERKYELPSKSPNLIPVGIISEVRKRNLKRIVIGNLNFTSIRYKFDKLIDIIKGNLDVIIIS